jgi:hypothetical protein
MTELSINSIIEDLRSDILENRVNSIKHLAQIGQALGKERSRKELVPFLSGLRILF